MNLSEFLNAIPLDHKVKLYVPTTMKDGLPIQERENHLKRYQENLAVWLGGATCYEAQGVWKGPHGLVTELVTILESYCEKEALKNHMENILGLVTNMKEELNQDSIAFEVNNKLYLL